MTKPIDDKDNKNPNQKKPIELSSNTMMILNNAVIIVVLIISMVIMYILLDNSFEKKLKKFFPDQEQEELTEEDEVKQEGILLDLGEFILNLVDSNQRRYLKVSVAIELSKTEEETALLDQPAKAQGHGAAPVDNNALIIAEMERYKPAIRDAVISILSNKTSDELSTPTGKEIAKEEILETINGIFDGQREVLRVSFGQFIIQ